MEPVKKTNMISKAMNSDAYLIWNRRRKLTYILFAGIYFFAGLEFSCASATLWIYIKTVVPNSNPGLFYGLINAAVFLPAFIFLPFIGRWFDKTRRLRLCMLTTNFVSIIGSVLYTIPFSPFFLLIGRFFLGFNMLVVPLTISEIARTTDPESLNSIMPFLRSFSNLGFVTGPTISMFFTEVNFWIGNIHITYANVVGIELFVMLIGLQLGITYLAHDLSKEFDLKLYLTGETNVNAEESRMLPMFQILKSIIFNMDMLLIFVMTFTYTIMDQSFFRSLPILIIDHFKLSYKTLNFYLLFTSMTTFLLIFLLVRCKVNSKQTYILGIVSTLALMLIMNTFLVALKVQINNIYLVYLLLLTTCFLIAVFILVDKVFTSVMSARLAKSSHQARVESMRWFLKQIGYVFGALTSNAYLTMFTYLFYPVYTVIGIVFLVSLYFRRNTLKDPKATI